MKNVALWLKQNPLYAVAGLVLAATVFSVGCQPTATYRGEQVNAGQLEVKRQTDLRAIEVQIISLQADAAAIQAEADLAAGEIAGKQAFIDDALAYVGDLILTVVTGGIANTPEKITGGLTLVSMLLGGGYMRQRVAKKAEDKGYDMGRTEAVNTLTSAK